MCPKSHQKVYCLTIILLLWKTGFTFAQQIIPGKLNFIVTYKYDTLKFEKLKVVQNNYVEANSYSNNASFSVLIFKEAISIGDVAAQEYYVSINTGSSLTENYDVNKIVIVKNNIDTMRFFFRDAHNISQYFLNILFQPGEFILPVNKIRQERLDFTERLFKEQCDKLKESAEIENCKQQIVRRETVFVKDDMVGMIVTPMEWKRFKIESKKQD